MDSGRACPRCGGYLYSDGEDLVCLQCGYTRVPATLPEASLATPDSSLPCPVTLVVVRQPGELSKRRAAILRAKLLGKPSKPERQQKSSTGSQSERAET